MRRLNKKHKKGHCSQTINNQWNYYRYAFLSLLIWWAIGAGIGLLFAIALDGTMKQTLAGHLEQGVAQLFEENDPSITYFFKRCLTYVQLLLIVWGLECWTYGLIGVRILLWGRGFLYGFSQNAWVLAYGIKGVLLGAASYIPHNLLFTATTAWVEWWLSRSGVGRKVSLRLLIAWLVVTVPVIAWVEVFWTPGIVKACM